MFNTHYVRARSPPSYPKLKSTPKSQNRSKSLVFVERSAKGCPNSIRARSKRLTLPTERIQKHWIGPRCGLFSEVGLSTHSAVLMTSQQRNGMFLEKFWRNC